jgi:hypothetical protein
MAGGSSKKGRKCLTPLVFSEGVEQKGPKMLDPEEKSDKERKRRRWNREEKEMIV